MGITSAQNKQWNMIILKTAKRVPKSYFYFSKILRNFCLHAYEKKKKNPKFHFHCNTIVTGINIYMWEEVMTGICLSEKKDRKLHWSPSTSSFHLQNSHFYQNQNYIPGLEEHPQVWTVEQTCTSYRTQKNFLFMKLKVLKGYGYITALNNTNSSLLMLSNHF